MVDPVSIGRIGRAHGIRGEVSVDVRTDAPELRFVPGSRLDREPPGDGPLVVEHVREHSGRLLVQFAGVSDRTAAEALSGTFLLLDAEDQGDAGPDAWWDGQLVGLRAETSEGLAVGVVTDVVHTAAQDLLVVTSAAGREALIPFVTEIVPEVDIAGGRLILDPPQGLLEL